LIKEVVRFTLNESSPELFVEGNMVIPDNPISMVISLMEVGVVRKVLEIRKSPLSLIE
jgi:hypothetical protein